jgi:hypothetical protein
MRRRRLIAAIGGATFLSSPPVHAQRPGMPVIGFLGTATALSPDIAAIFLPPFEDGLKESG